MIYCKKFLLNTSLIISLISYVIPSDQDQEELKQLSQVNKLEGFLNKNKLMMTKVGKGRYTVSNNQFDIIFPSCSISQSNYNSAVGFIENETVDISTGISSVSAGSGTIIENNYNTIKVITAAHVVRKQGTITFTLASMLTMPNTANVSSFADYRAKKVFLHNTKDVAYIECELESDRVSLPTQAVPDKTLKTYFMNRNHQAINGRKKVVIYHYPFAVENQRFNMGSIFSGTEEHTVPTLGGSSGAPVIFNDQIIGIHVSAGISKGGTANYNSEKLDFYQKNEYVRLSTINQDLSDFIERV